MYPYITFHTRKKQKQHKHQQNKKADNKNVKWVSTNFKKENKKTNRKKSKNNNHNSSTSQYSYITISTDQYFHIPVLAYESPQPKLGSSFG